jgi:hypothetical protein
MLELSAAMMVDGFVLCAPLTHRYLSRYLFALSHTAYMLDFFGHAFFIASTSMLIYAVGFRLVGDDAIKRLMARVDKPGAAALVGMLAALTFSHSTRHLTALDFFEVRPDAWLKLYWLIYGGLEIYLLGYLIRLLLVLRHDPRSRTADLYLVAAVAGIVNLAMVVVDEVAGLGLTGKTLWPSLLVSGVLVGAAGVWRWGAGHQRRQIT